MAMVMAITKRMHQYAKLGYNVCSADNQA